MKNPVLILALLALPVALFSCNDSTQTAGAPAMETQPSQSPTHSGPDGKALFMANCASCHNPMKDATGPALNYTLESWNNDTAKVRAFVRNSSKVIVSGDKHAVEVYKKWSNYPMPSFPNLSNEDIDAILNYTETYGKHGQP